MDYEKLSKEELITKRITRFKQKTFRFNGNTK